MRYIVKVVDSHSFIPRTEHTLLEAMEYQNIELQFQCRRGYCGSCQVDMLEGSVEYLYDAIAFIAEGKILPCCCCAKSDLVVIQCIYGCSHNFTCLISNF